MTDYRSGIVHRIQSWKQANGAALDVMYQVYAHRALPSLLLQDIKVRLWWRCCLVLYWEVCVSVSFMHIHWFELRCW